MKFRFLCGATALLAGTFLTVTAVANDDVKSAAKKLAEKANYSWTSTTEVGGAGQQFRPGPTDGKLAGDVTWVSTTFGQNTSEMVLKGAKGAAKTQDGWKSVAELTEGEATQENRGRRFLGRMLQNFKAPAAQAEDLIAKTKSLEKTGDAYSGELTAEGVTELLTFGRRAGGNAPAPTNAKGSAKFWLKDGVLSKFEYNVQGTVTFNNNEVNVDRTTTVEIKDVGTTKVEVPEEAKGKL